jgi:hypothetical protein
MDRLRSSTPSLALKSGCGQRDQKPISVLDQHLIDLLAQHRVLTTSQLIVATLDFSLGHKSFHLFNGPSGRERDIIGSFGRRGLAPLSTLNSRRTNNARDSFACSVSNGPLFRLLVQDEFPERPSPRSGANLRLFGVGWRDSPFGCLQRGVLLQRANVQGRLSGEEHRQGVEKPYCPKA